MKRGRLSERVLLGTVLFLSVVLFAACFTLIMTTSTSTAF